MINVPGMAPALFDTTGLENSFENLGRTMADVLNLQKQTNVALKIKVEGPMRQNETQWDTCISWTR